MITEKTHFTPISLGRVPSLLGLQWAPDGKKISFLTKEYSPSDVETIKIKDTLVTIDPERKLNSYRLCVIDIDLAKRKISESKVLTPTTMTIFSEVRGNKLYSWSPDSRQVVFSYIPLENNDEYQNAMRISMVDVTTGKTKDLSKEGPASDPSFSPDGRTLAFVVPDPYQSSSPRKKVELLLDAMRICLLDLTTYKKTYLATTPNEWPKIIGWNAEGDHLIVEDFHKTTNVLYAVPINGNSPTAFPMGDVKYFQGDLLNQKRTHIGFIGESLVLPPEAYSASLKDFSFDQLTTFHQEYLKLPAIKSEVVTWTSFDGKEIEGLFLYPFSFQEGQRFPLVVVVHGGPAEIWQENYMGFIMSAQPSPALLVQKGFGVFLPNIRGSDGYGSMFRQANYKNWGEGPFKDLMTGVDFLIAKGLVDPNKLAIEGWSYGGYLTAWTIAHTNRFKAAIVGAGDVDLISYLSTSNASSLTRSCFGGDYWEDYKTYLENSPLMYAQNIKTPTLIQHGEKDDVIPITQGIELYHVLKTRNIPVKMLIYRGQDHGLFNQASIQGSYDALSWIQHYINHQPSPMKSQTAVNH